jgi:LmbE family N-acetylglucosaminyl deacetylase
MREKESVKALTVLGVSDYEFLRFPDRELYTCYEKVLERLLEIIKGYTPDVIYSPSIIELNPDHRATAALSVEIRKRIPENSTDCSPIKIVFYEVTTPLRPNMLIDVTSVYGRKKKAMKKYKSQLGILDFVSYINALNKVRSLTVQDAGYVEAFWSIEHPFADEYMERWLTYQSVM